MPMGKKKPAIKPKAKVKKKKKTMRRGY